MQKSSNLDFEDDSNLRGIQPNEIIKSKPDSYYLEQNNKIVCDSGDILVQDITKNKDPNDNHYCYNNGENKKLVQWKKVDNLWISRTLTNTSEYKEVDGNVCKIVTEACDAYNPSDKCVLKCFLNDKSVKTFTANYQAFP
jgi:hypothetical protein